MMIRDVRYSRNFFSFIAVLVPYLPYLTLRYLNATIFFFNSSHLLLWKERHYKVGIVIVIMRGATCRSNLHSKDKYLLIKSKVGK